MLHGKFRWKAVLSLVVICALLGVGWFFLHRYQMKSIHSRFLAQATRAEEAKPPQYDRAVRFLRIYLLAKGDDTDALARYGILIEERATPNYKTRLETLGIYERVLTQDPSRQEILLRAAKLYMMIGKLDDAQRHLLSLKQAGSPDATVDMLLGDCQQVTPESDKDKRQILWKAAEDNYRAAIRRAPQKLEPYIRLAALLRGKQNKPLEASQVLEELIQANPDSAMARVVRARYRQFSGDDKGENFGIVSTRILGLLGSPLGQGPVLATSVLVITPIFTQDLFGADEDLAIARKLAPDDAEVLLISASQEVIRAQQKGQTNPKTHLGKAKTYLNRGDELYTKDTRFLAQLATVERLDGNVTAAIDHLRDAQKKASGQERNRLLWDMVNLLIDGDLSKNLPEAQEMIEQLQKNRMPAPRLDVLRARIKFRQGQWSSAADLLQTARHLLVEENKLVPDKALVMQVDLLLGLCAEQLNNADQQVEIYKRALKLDPFHPTPRLRLAMALASLNRLDEAIIESEHLRSLPQSTAAGKLLSARLLILKNRRLPESNRDWLVVKQILDATLKQDESTARDVYLLNAEVASLEEKVADPKVAKKVGKGDDKKSAKQRLEDARTKWPDAVEPWIGLADLEPEAQGLKILEDAVKVLGDRPELRVARLNPRFVPQKKEEALAYLQPLSKDLDRFDRTYQMRLLVILADAYERMQDLAEAERLLQKFVQLQPDQLRTRLVIFDYYLRTENGKGMEDVVADIKRIEGADEQPFGNYVQAQIELFHAGERLRRLGKPMDQLTPEEKQPTPDEKKHFNAARKYLLIAQARRPKWSRISVSLAIIADVEGDTELMTKHLLDAVEFGNRQPQVIRALVFKLMDNRQYAKAEEVMLKLQAAAPITDAKLDMQAAEISAYNQNSDRALELTLRAVSSESKNYKDHLWQGQMLAILNKPKEAEKSLRDAIKWAGDDPSAWVALIQFFQNRVGDPQRATKALKDMKEAIPAAKLPLALAHCYQIMGDPDEAQKAYAAALAAHPDSMNVVKGAAGFYLGVGKVKEAETHLRQMIDSKPKIPDEERAWARRNLAMALWFQENPEKQSEAMKLIEENLKAQSATVDDQIVKGMLLATKRESRAEAVTILEKAFSVRLPTPDQMFAMANLYEAAGDWPKGREKMKELLRASTKHDKYRRFLSAFVDKLMIRGDYVEADIWLAKLQESIETHLKSQQSELLANRLALDAYLLTELARRHPRLIPDIKMSGAALKSFAAKSEKKESQLAVAEFLASCQQLEESLKICENVIKDLPLQQIVPVAVTAVATNTGPPNASTLKQIQRVEDWVILAKKQKPDARELDFLLAILKERRGSYADAEALYRSVLQKTPESAMVLNNLAFLIGLRGNTDEAYAMIQKAIKKVGPAGDFLDSRAAILLRIQDRLPDAEKDIQDALRQQRTPGRLFHLAQILRTAGKTKESMQEFLEAEKLGLRIEMLHPLEFESFLAFEKSK
jgi:cellulose synthase operon protein C